MTEPNKRVVQRRDDGNWEVRKPGSDRASAVTSTQAEGINRARDILRNDGGGELQVRSLKGTIREQDTIPPRERPALLERLGQMRGSIIGCSLLATGDDQLIKSRGHRDKNATRRVSLSSVHGEEKS